MTSEKCLMNIFLFEIKFNISYKGIAFVIRPVWIINMILTMISILIHLKAIVIFISETINYIIFFLGIFLMVCILVTDFVKRFLKEDTAKAVYRDITDHDAEIELFSAEGSDWLMFSLFGVYPLVVFGSINMLYAAQVRDVSFWFMTYGSMICTLNIHSLVIVKHVILKRLKNIESMEDIDQIILNSRLAFDWNNRINRHFELKVTFYAIHIFIYGLHITQTIWAIHVVKLQAPGAMENYIVPCIFEYVGYLLILYLLAHFDSTLTEQVDEIKLKLKMITVQDVCPEKERTVVSVFLMELHHVPVEFSALGLFTINPSSFATACCVFISYMLVLIQYT